MNTPWGSFKASNEEISTDIKDELYGARIAETVEVAESWFSLSHVNAEAWAMKLEPPSKQQAYTIPFSSPTPNLPELCYVEQREQQTVLQSPVAEDCLVSKDLPASKMM